MPNVSIKNGVTIKINDVEYSAIMPKEIAIPFIVKNIKRYSLFEAINDLEERIIETKTSVDFEPLDNINSNDNDIFVYGVRERLPIKVARYIYRLNIDEITVLSSKAIIQENISNATIERQNSFKEQAIEWIDNRTVDGNVISIDGIEIP